MKNTSIQFTLPTESVTIFSKKLYPLAKTDTNSKITFTAHENTVIAFFKSAIDDSGVQSHFEYIFQDVDVKTPGVTSVMANDIADVILRYPNFKNPNKPHTKALNFIGKPESLKIKTTVYWNENASPTNQQLTISTVKLEDTEETSPLHAETVGDKSVLFGNNEFISAVDMCSFIKGDLTSKDEFGYWIHTEEDDVVMLATDLRVASRFKLKPLSGSSKLDAVIGRSILNAIRTFIQGPEPVSVRTFKRVIYLESGNRKMAAPLLKGDFPINSEMFFKESTKLASVEIDSLSHILSHFLSIDKDPYHKTTFEFDSNSNVFKLCAGENGINNVDSLPASIEGSGQFDADATTFNSILPRLKKLGAVCEVSVDSTESKSTLITLTSQDSDARYLIRGLSRSNAG